MGEADVSDSGQRFGNEKRGGVYGEGRVETGVLRSMRRVEFKVLEVLQTVPVEKDGVGGGGDSIGCE